MNFLHTVVISIAIYDGVSTLFTVGSRLALSS